MTFIGHRPNMPSWASILLGKRLTDTTAFYHRNLAADKIDAVVWNEYEWNNSKPLDLHSMVAS